MLKHICSFRTLLNRGHSFQVTVLSRKDGWGLDVDWRVHTCHSFLVQQLATQASTTKTIMSVLSYIIYLSSRHSGHFPTPKLEKDTLPTGRNLFTRWKCIAKIYLIRTKPGCQVVADVTASPPRNNPAVTL